MESTLPARNDVMGILQCKKISHQGGKKKIFCAINLFFLHNARAAKYNSDVNGWPCLTYTDMK